MKQSLMSWEFNSSQPLSLNFMDWIIWKTTEIVLYSITYLIYLKDYWIDRIFKVNWNLIHFCGDNFISSERKQ